MLRGLPLRNWKLVVAGLGLTLTLVACGSSSPSPASSTSSSSGCSGVTGKAPAGTTATQVVAVVANPSTVGAYSPTTVTVKVGQAVEWKWQDPNNQHSVTSDTCAFSSGLQSNGSTFTVVFSKAGSYSYHCIIHSGMLGTVTVTS